MARRVLLLAAAGTAAGGAVPAGFAHHFSCPFARVWLEHGAEKAAKMLGVEPHAGAEAADVARCTPAPGFPGGAHQHARSPGYATNCSGTPAQASPYMWPLRWKANIASQSMSFGNKTPSRASSGMSYYRFDKNWKRGDSFSASGTLSSTVLHKNDKMTFIMWGKNGTKIELCSWMNMTIIGNLRPDWFLDSRGGGSIDSQYLGKEHVYYRGEPRLVRKWRKNDFVDTVFTVSMDEYGDANGTRWPLILNIPGEEMGPDSLRQHWGHTPLDADDVAPFLIDEAHVAAGGLCPKIPVSGGPGVGPKPGGGGVPSALDKDVNGWRSVVWTASPFAPAPRPPAPAPAPAPPQGGAYACGVCRHVYNATADGGGKAFEELPSSWVCPVCGAPKSSYKKQSAGAWAH